MGYTQRQVARDDLQASISQSAPGTSARTLDVRAGKAVDVFINVTVAGTNITFNVQAAGNGSNFGTVKSLVVTTTGVFVLAVKRGVEGLGEKIRVTWTVVSGSFTFDIIANRQE